MYLRLPVYDEQDRETGHCLVVPIDALPQGWLVTQHVKPGDTWTHHSADHVLSGCSSCTPFREQANRWKKANTGRP